MENRTVDERNGRLKLRLRCETDDYRDTALEAPMGWFFRYVDDDEGVERDITAQFNMNATTVEAEPLRTLARSVR